MARVAALVVVFFILAAALSRSSSVADETARPRRSGFSSLRLIYPEQMPRRVEIGQRQLFVDDYHIASVKGPSTTAPLILLVAERG